MKSKISNKTKLMSRRQITILLVIFDLKDTEYSTLLQTFATQFSDWFDQVRKDEGTRQAIELAKQVNHAAIMIATGRPVPALRFRKSKNNIPQILTSVKHLLLLPRTRRYILSVTQSYRRILLPINPDLGPITEPGVEIDPNLKEKFDQFIKRN